MEGGERGKECTMKTRQTVQKMLTRAVLYRCINSSDLYTLHRVKHEGHVFEDSLGYLGRPCFK